MWRGGRRRKARSLHSFDGLHDLLCLPPLYRPLYQFISPPPRPPQIMNWLSYFAVEDLAWLGMSGMVKDFRKRILQLTDYSKENGSHTIHHSKV